MTWQCMNCCCLFWYTRSKNMCLTVGIRWLDWCFELGLNCRRGLGLNHFSCCHNPQFIFGTACGLAGTLLGSRWGHLVPLKCKKTAPTPLESLQRSPDSLTGGRGCLPPPQGPHSRCLPKRPRCLALRALLLPPQCIFHSSNPGGLSAFCALLIVWNHLLINNADELYARQTLY